MKLFLLDTNWLIYGWMEAYLGNRLLSSLLGSVGRRLRLGWRLALWRGLFAGWRRSSRFLLGATSGGQVLWRNLLYLRPSPLLFLILKLVAHLFNHVGCDGGRVVSPIGSNIGQNRRKLLIGVLTLPGLHGVVKWFPFDLDRSLQAFKHDGNELIGCFPYFHRGTGERRILPGHTLAIGLMAG